MYITLGFSVLILYALYLIFEKYFANSKQKIVLATQNVHKIEEINQILPENIEIISLTDIGFHDKLIETGNRLQNNALQKVHQIAKPYAVDVIADDTGLEVEALHNQPGVYSARYAGEHATYQDNVDKLLKELEGVENRKAQFRTVIAFSDANKELLFEGIIKGSITHEQKGENGFGYDSVFMPEGYDITFAEMSLEEKNKISHRAKALALLKDYFEKK
jgi:XTP/dITP diphosphohydrolase